MEHWEQEHEKGGIHGVSSASNDAKRDISSLQHLDRHPRDMMEYIM
jgi:hypothetical protein